MSFDYRVKHAAYMRFRPTVSFSERFLYSFK